MILNGEHEPDLAIVMAIDPSLAAAEASAPSEQSPDHERSVLNRSYTEPHGLEANRRVRVALSTRICTSHRVVLWSMAKCTRTTRLSCRRAHANFISTDQSRLDRNCQRDSGYVLATDNQSSGD